MLLRGDAPTEPRTLDEEDHAMTAPGPRPDHRAAPARTGLVRSLGVPTLVFFGLAYMVPMTVFTTYGIVNEVTGGFLASAYVITLAAMLFTACSYAFLGRRIRSAGSAYAYARE